MNYIAINIFIGFLITGCVMKFEVPSAKSKLEKQVLGYSPTLTKEQLRSIVVRSDYSGDYNVEQAQALRRKLKPQVVSMIASGVLGEAIDGTVHVLESKKWQIAYNAVNADAVSELARDENYARKILSSKEGKKMRDFRYAGIDNAWYQNNESIWIR